MSMLPALRAATRPWWRKERVRGGGGSLMDTMDWTVESGPYSQADSKLVMYASSRSRASNSLESMGRSS